MKTGRYQTGYSLVEALVCLSLMGILFMASSSAWSSKIDSTRLNGRVHELIQDMHWIRSIAVEKKQSVRLSVQQLGTGSCYVVHTGAAQACTCQADGVAICQNGAQAYKTTFFPSNEQLTLQSNSASMLWNPVHGTTTPTGTVRLESAMSGQSVHLVVNVLGRVRVCSPNAWKSAFPTC